MWDKRDITYHPQFSRLHTFVHGSVLTTYVGLPKQVVGCFPLGLGLVRTTDFHVEHYVKLLVAHIMHFLINIHLTTNQNFNVTLELYFIVLLECLINGYYKK